MKQDILNSNLQDVTIIGDITSHKAEIDAEDLGWILQILSSNLYSDPIGSLVREYSSNAWDANVEAGNKDKPIEVGIQTDKDQGTYWYVTDLGPGISPDRIDKIYRKFGKSTKRESNEAIGMMGLGKFSGLSYSDQIYITTRHNGMQYQYIMHKADGLPQIDMLGISPSDLPSGTTIKVFIKGWSDRRDFVNATKHQLCFFENIYFNIDDEKDMNDYKMIKGKSFTYSELSERKMRIKLGPVSYPLDWYKLSENVKATYEGTQNFNYLALNFNIGDLAITPNRESILYNKKTIENIEKKLAEFDKEMVALYDARSGEIEDIEDYVTMYKTKAVKIGENLFHLTKNQAAQVTKPVRLKGFPYDLDVDDWREVLCDYVGYANIQNGKKTKQSKDSDGSTRYTPLHYNLLEFLNGEHTGAKVLLMQTHTLDPKRTKFMSETHNQNNWICIKEVRRKLFPKKDSYTNPYYRHNETCYFNLLRLNKLPRDKWRERIKLFQQFQKDFIMSQEILKYDDMNPTKAWLAAQRALAPNSGNGITALRKSNGKILVKIAENPSTYNTIASFRPNDVKLATLPDYRSWIVYGTEEEKDLLAKVYTFQNFKTRMQNTKDDIVKVPNIKVWLVAKANHKYFKDIPNFIHVNDLLEGKNKLAARLATMALVYREASQHFKWFSSMPLLQVLDSKAGEVVKTIGALQSGVWNCLHSSHSAQKAESLHDTLLVKAAEHNMWDFKMLALLNEFKVIYDKYSYLNLLKTTRNSGYERGSIYMNGYDRDVIEFAIDTAKRRKIRLQLEHYLKPVIEQNDESEEPC